MVFKTRIDSGYVFVLGVFTLFTAGFLYNFITNTSIMSLIPCVVFLITELLFVFPMYFFTRYEFRQDNLLIRVGWYVNRAVIYTDIFAFQLSSMEANASYGLSEKRIALFLMDNNGKNDVITISPKSQSTFIDILCEKTGLTITPPDPTYREVQDEYDKNTTPDQRKDARKRLWNVLTKGYAKEHLKPTTPESFAQNQATVQQDENAK